MSAYVYTLNLKGGNKYVGYTQNLEKRLEQHFSGNGSKWTQKHQPISINSTQEVSSVNYAKKLETIIYHKMKDYHGKDKVRGAGNTSSVINTKKQILKKEVVEEVWECDYCDRTFSSKFGCSVHEKSCNKPTSSSCFRCGREGHYKQDCYASTHIKGYYISN